MVTKGMDFSTPEMNMRAKINSLWSFSTMRTHHTDSHYCGIGFTLVNSVIARNRDSSNLKSGSFIAKMHDYKGTRNFMRVLGEISFKIHSSSELVNWLPIKTVQILILIRCSLGFPLCLDFLPIPNS